MSTSRSPDWSLSPPPYLFSFSENNLFVGGGDGSFVAAAAVVVVSITSSSSSSSTIDLHLTARWFRK
jgi:hypothetical protein